MFTSKAIKSQLENIRTEQVTMQEELRAQSDTLEKVTETVKNINDITIILSERLDAQLDSIISLFNALIPLLQKQNEQERSDSNLSND